jgi:cytochrome oxidase Cu insertion factor (SCO1/SenC/PrrC family)
VTRRLGTLLALWIGLAPAAVAGHGMEDHAALPPTPAGAPLFEPPEPGSYELPPISRVPDYELLDPEGRPAPILGLASGEVAIVSFIYTSCSQADGCPLALATLRRLDRQLAERSGLGSNVRLVTVSFDPARDTPHKMSELRSVLEPKGDWRFLTAPSDAKLAPVLRSFGQDVVRLAGAGETQAVVLRHVLKVFLVDASGDVRNIYSTGFLDPRLILGDVETLLGPTGGRAVP